jgi:geranylgeranylglycerol-phosphate geranylgeranyltransferase
MQEKNKRNEEIKRVFWATQPMNWFIAGAGTLAGCLVLDWNQSFFPQILLAVFAAVFIVAAGGALNSYLSPEKGMLSLAILNFVVFSFVIGLTLSLLIGTTGCRILAFVNIGTILFYESFFKKKDSIKNIVVGYLAGSVFLFGGAAIVEIDINSFRSLAVGDVISNPITWLFALGFFANIGREFFKDARNVDRRREFRTKIIATSFIVLAIILTVFLYSFKVLGDFEAIYLLLIPANIMFVAAITILLVPHLELGHSELYHLRFYTNEAIWAIKIGMLFALGPFIAGGIL